MTDTDPLAEALRYDHCHEAVSRRGEEQPCDKPAVALALDSGDHRPYPVCAYHSRGDMVPLSAVHEYVAAVKSDRDGWRQGAEQLRQLLRAAEADRDRLRAQLDAVKDRGPWSLVIPSEREAEMAAEMRDAADPEATDD